MTVVDLGDIRASDAERVGPKMARLGQLAADGWRVPDGYAITAASLAGWLPGPARAELDRLFAASAGDLAGLATAARELVEAQPLPSWLVDEVCQAHGGLEQRTGRGGSLRVAVRSSAVGEDGHAASFAGQYESYLGVRGVVDVLVHIRKCWASGYSAHALEYRRRFGGPGSGGTGSGGTGFGGTGFGGTAPLRVHDLAVGVLELVDARSAGVAFTLDPVTGNRSTLVVEGNWGFGESVVSGHVSPDHWTVDRASMRVLTARIGAKRTWAVSAGPAGRVTLAPLPDDLAGQPCLTEDEVRRICEQAARIEAAAGGVPQDVEWAVARDRELPDSVYILQHRPETTWAPAPPAPGGAGTDPAAPADPAKAFDPVQYALRNVFKVPGT